MKVEADGDIHIELVDANDNKTGIVGAEIPPSQIWCELRKLALSWTTQKFLFSFSSSKNLTVVGRHVTTVTGKAFYDVDQAPKDRSLTSESGVSRRDMLFEGFTRVMRMTQ